MAVPEQGLVGCGFDHDIQTWMQAAARRAPGAVAGRVTRTDRGACLVLTGGGAVEARTRRTVGEVVTGDWVAVLPADHPDGGGSAVIVAAAPRRSALTRSDPSRTGEPQVLAANVDLVFLVAGLDRPLRPGRIERGLVLAWDSGIEPVLVLTKADLAANPGGAAAEVATIAPGAAVHVTSAVTGEGLDALAGGLGGWKTAALLGESGAGKSTLVNRLAGSETLWTSPVRRGDAKGRHTTTARHLVPLRSGGTLLDTPGLRQLGLWAGEDGLVAAFPDIDALAGRCRFRDCAHRSEPACAVRAAIDAGELSARRLAGYEKLVREIEHQSGVVSEHERRRLGRQFQRESRAIKEERRRRQ